MRTGFVVDIVIAMAFVALGAGIVVLASDFRSVPGMVVGSGLFPSITGAAMVVFGLVMAFGAVRATRHFDPVTEGRTTDDADRNLPSASAPPLFDRYSLAVISALAMLIIAMPTAGFLATGFAFSVFAVRLGGGRWTGAIVFGAIATLCIYLVFTHGLRVPLPRGPF